MSCSTQRLAPKVQRSRAFCFGCFGRRYTPVSIQSESALLMVACHFLASLPTSEDSWSSSRRADVNRRGEWPSGTACGS